MKLLVLPLLLAFAPLYEVAAAAALGGGWTVRRSDGSAPVEFSTDPANPSCRVRFPAGEAPDVGHALYKARELPGTKWFHVTAYGHTVMAKSIDGIHVQVLAANADPIDITHAACVLTLLQTPALHEVEALESAVLEAGAY